MPTGEPGVVDVTVIIVNYNVREFLKQSLSSVYRARGDLQIDVIVVDNDSVDGSTDLVSAEFEDATLIRNNRNVGFGVANNQAIRESTGRYLLILNPDTIVQEDTLTTLVSFMDDHPTTGAIGCKILNPDGTFAPESRRAFPTPAVAFYRMSGLSRLFPNSKTFGRYNLTFMPADEAGEVDALSGSCMMLRRAALISSLSSETAAATASAEQICNVVPDRLFDEEFFMYGEDLDLCYRIQAAGWRIYYTPETQIIHYKGESTRKGDLRYVKLFYGAMLLFAEKHFRQRSRLFRAALRFGIVIRAAASAVMRGVRASALPALDFAMVYLAVTMVAVLRFGGTFGSLGLRFFLTMPPLYAASAVIGIHLTGGYNRGRKRVRPVLAGLLTAVVAVASLSFFIKTIAYSRFVILASAVPALAMLLSWRFATNRRRTHPNRALVVGDGLEAARLKIMIASHLRPPFSIVGYVALDGDDLAPALPVRNLGSFSQLRDIIRLWRIDEVIFATGGLQNQTLVSLMSRLRDLPVEFKTFVERGTIVIGKAKVDDLSVPLVSTDATIGRAGRGHLAGLADRLIAMVAFAVLVSARMWRPRADSVLGERQALLRGVLAGRLGLIGRRTGEEDALSDEWDLPDGAFSVSDALSTRDPAPEDIRRAWQVYLNNRSLSMDLEIVLKGIRRTLKQSGE